MFRSKKDVDRHVQNIFSKLRNENEKNLRCYNVAKLYYQVGDYESTKRYVSSYLEVRDSSASAHKLLGQAYEALGQKEAAFNEYKTSLELEGRQDDLVLKVCELLVDTDIRLDSSRIKYWIERADKQFPHNPVVFQLKEKLLTMEKPNNSSKDLEALITSELAARPTDVQLRIKLLNHYMSENRLDKAYEHVITIEGTVRHRNSIVWYQLLYELLTKCKETKSCDWFFWFYYISTSERYAALCLKEQGSEIKKSIPEATQAVFNFDQNLKEMNSKEFSKEQYPFTEHLFLHMWGQLNFHLACLLLRKTKREQGSWSEAGRLSAPLFLTALDVGTLPTGTRVHLIADELKNQYNTWNQDASYRCCQAGHILQDYAKDDMKKLMDKIDKFCTGLWRERVFQRIFLNKIYIDHSRTSYFCNYSTSDSLPLRFCTAAQLRFYYQRAQMVWPDSLHHQIWFGMKFRSHHKDNIFPDAYSHVFPSLQISISNMNQAAPESLCLMDIDAFLNAAIICASAMLEEQQFNSFMNPEKLPTLPVDLTPTLSTSNQEKWWSAAYKMYSKQEDNNISNISELRQELQQGLEVVRCIGNHGLHPVLLIHLARMFHHRAVQAKEREDEEDVLPWDARSDMYWTAAIPLLERLQNNQTLRMSPSKLFNYQGKEMSTNEIADALEEGKFQLAQRFVREKQYEQAIDALQSLKYPEASFQQSLIYRIFADDIINNTPRESLTSEMRSQHIIMLSKARNCLYLTLDRLRSPGVNPKHPLNAELADHIATIENKLKRIDPDLGRGDISRNDCDGISDESYSPAHSAIDPIVAINPVLPVITPVSISNILSTPQRNVQRVPRHTSTPCRQQHQDYLNISKNRTEARPSPERLDAQIRQIMQSRDSEMQELTEQMKGMMLQMKTLTDKVDTLTKEVVELRKETQKQQQQRAHQQQQNVNPVEPDDFYVFDDDEYNDLTTYPNQSTAPASTISGNMFTPQHRHPYSSLVYPSPTAFQGYYQGGLPFTDPNTQAAISTLYPHTVYPMPVLYPNQSKVPENPLQQSLFAPTLSSQLPDLMPAAAAAAAAAAVANSSLQIPPLQQKIETPRTKPEATRITSTTATTTIIKTAAVNKAPPVNVVITSSDTLPTTIPPIQPILSVTIPPQYRLGTPGTFTSTPMTTATTGTMTTIGITPTTTKLPASSDAPHCYQIPMPSQATIPTTVNLPPSTIYVTLGNNIPSMYTSLTSNIPVMTTQATQEIQAITTWSNIHQNESIKIPDKTTDISIKPLYEPIESPNTSTEVCEQEHDPIPDFVPVIPLPAKVKVTTGEEDEISLYCGRAKLYRFADKEWKERGIGYVKLLRNTEGKVRLLMRRDQVLKICANHMLRPDIELTAMPNNNKAWCWVANDFADEEVKLEKLCIRFKTVEEAIAFKEAFDQAKLNSTVTSPEKSSNGKTSLISSSNDKDVIKNQKSQATQQAKISSTIEATSIDKSKTGATTLGGFIFSSTPIIQEVSDTDANKSKKSEEPAKISPFSGFSFTKLANKSETKITTTITTSTISSTNFIFGTSTTSTTTSQSDLMHQSVASPIFTSSNQNSATLRRSRLPLSGTKAESLNEAQTEDEENLFDGIANFQYQDMNSNTKQWKDKGRGSMKLLLNMKSRKLHLLITNDGGTKLYSHEVSLDMSFTYKNGTTIVNWTIPKDTKEPGNIWSLYAATFSTSELASQFYNTVLNSRYNLTKGYSTSEVVKEFGSKFQVSSSEKKVENLDKSQPPPLSEIFKPPIGSWECNSCYTRNNATDIKCVACETPSSLKTNNDKTSSIAVTTKSVDSISKQPLSELFKPATGSWPCPECYVVNSGANVYCVACDKPKDPSQPPKPQQNVFQLNVSSSTAAPITTFSFGIPKDVAKETTNSSFSFRMEDKSINDNAKMTLTKPEEISGTTSFVFGMPVKSGTMLNSGNKPFTFGSPTKSFNFNFMSKSPTKSPGGGGGGGETSEDEVVESEDIHFSPVVPLPDKVEVKTGEENEEMLYSHRAKLFRFDTTVKEWKERGLGDIKLLRHKETGKLRLVMRRDHVLKLCLNHLLSAELEFTPKDEKTWLWATADYSDGEIEYMQFACRFKTAEIAMDFKKMIDDARKDIIISSDSEKIDNQATTMQATKISSPAEEIEIVYEIKVTPEEKAAALKLQLPENFYAYKQKEDCKGCRGCKEPDIVLYPNITTEDLDRKSRMEENKLITPSKLASSITTLSSSDTNKNIETVQNVLQPTSVKNGFSFSSTKTIPATSNIFDGSTMSFGTSDLKLFNDKKATTFSFGMNPQFSANETAEKPITTASISLENVNICNPFNVQTTQTTVSDVTGHPVFGQTTSTTSIFKTPTFSFDTSKNIFGGAADLSKTSVFGANSDGNSLFGKSLSSFNTMKISTTATTVSSTPSLTTSTLGTGSFVFGSAITQTGNTTATISSTVTFNVASQSSNSIFDSSTTNSVSFSKIFDNSTSSFSSAAMTTNAFGVTTTPTSNIFGRTTATTNVFSAAAIPATNIFGTTTTVTMMTTTTPTPSVFGTKLSGNIQKNEETVCFLSPNSMSFSALAATAVQPEAFKTDPNFKFAGAGSSVFGSKSAMSSQNSSVATHNKSREDSIQKEDNEEESDDNNEVDNEHDPYFEPIVPLPDAIEIRTGEEDEEKKFCNRAKLYRYDNATKEWKERGVGEMKILYHAGQGSYRLLLRREQVHKVVCNFLITSDVEFRPLSTSNQAWMWAGVNYAEQESCAEQLAVKFKSPDLAQQFKTQIDKIQQELREKKNIQDEEGCVGEGEENENHNQDNNADEQNEEANEEEDDEDEEEDDDQEIYPIIEKRATVFARWPDANKWEQVGLGNLAIHYDSDIYAERIVLKLDDSDEYASNTIISIDTVMQVEGKECIWSGIDYALEPPVRRVLRAVFSSVQAAQEMHTFFEDGVESAKQAGVVEYQE